MIQITTQQATEYVKGLLESKLQDAYEREYSISIEDVDDLHDYTIESEDICQIDRVYDALYSMLPVVLIEMGDFLDDIDDGEDVWGTYAMRETIGLCD